MASELDREAVEAGWEAMFNSDKPAEFNRFADGIRAFLAAAPAPDVEGLVADAKWGSVRQDDKDSRSISAIRADDKSVAHITVSKPWWADTDIDKIAAHIRSALTGEQP